MASQINLNDVYTDDIFDYLGLEHYHMGYWTEGTSDFRSAQEQSLHQLFDPLKLTQDSIVLDIGGGQAGAAIWLHRQYGCKVVVVDLVQSMVDEGRARIEQAGVESSVSIVCSDILAYEADDKTFDAIVSVESLQHIKHVDALFKKIDQLLKPGGQFRASVYLQY